MSYYLLITGKIVLLLLFGAVCIRTAILCVNCNRKFMLVDIKNAVKHTAVRKSQKIYIATLIFAVVLLFVLFGNSRQSASLNIALTYPEASSGLNPNGSRYNMSDIIGDEVLERAIKNGNLGDVTLEALKDGLDVEPAKEIENAEGLVSTQFVLSFQSNSKTGRLSGSKAVHAVAEAYRGWFIEKYSTNYSALNISFEDIENYDYPDLKNYLSNAINIISNFSSAFYEKDSSFQSSVTGESFGSINTKAWDINNTGLEGLDSYILSNGLSRDPSAYMRRLRYQYTEQCISYQNALQAYDVRLEAIRKYDNDMATVVYIPTYDMDNTFYMSKTKIGIDHFAADADTYSKTAADTLSTILNEKYLLRQIRTGTETKEAEKKAESMIASIREQVISLADITKKTVQDYMEITANGYIAISEPAGSFSGKIIFTIAAAMVFLGIVYVGRAMELLNQKSMVKKDEETV